MPDATARGTGAADHHRGKRVYIRWRGRRVRGTGHAAGRAHAPGGEARRMMEDVVPANAGTHKPFRGRLGSAVVHHFARTRAWSPACAGATERKRPRRRATGATDPILNFPSFADVARNRKSIAREPWRRHFTRQCGHLSSGVWAHAGTRCGYATASASPHGVIPPHLPDGAPSDQPCWNVDARATLALRCPRTVAGAR